MDIGQLHLLFNHLPVFGSIIGALVLIQGLFTKVESTIRAAYGIFIISALGAGLSYATGAPAEARLLGVQNISPESILRHKESADYALIATILLGTGSIAGLYISLRKPSLARKWTWVLLTLSLMSFGVVARTNYLGSEIRHPGNIKKTPEKGPVPDSLKSPGRTDNPS